MRTTPSMSPKRSAGFLLLLLSLPAAAAAWQDAAEPPPADAAAEAQAAQAECPSLAGVSVQDAYKVPDLEKRPAGAQAPAVSRSVKLRDTIAVRVRNLDRLLQHVRCEEERGRKAGVILYLEDRPLPDVAAYPPTDPAGGQVLFPLHRTEASRDVWTYLLGEPSLDPRPVEISIGLDTPRSYPLPSDAVVMLRVIPKGWLTFWALIFGALLLGFLILANKSDVLRDPAPAAEGRRAYSLALTQAAWWFFLILGSYLFIGMITGDFSGSITGTVLVLLGISAGTAVGSAFVDASKEGTSQAERTARLRALNAELSAAGSRLQAANAALQADPADPAAQQEISVLQQSLETSRRQVEAIRQSRSNHHFILDILSDADGVNFHRFQIVAWSVVLGIIFVGQVYRELAMPQFDETLLGLMGISSGTYLGLKIPEKTVPTPPQGS